MREEHLVKAIVPPTLELMLEEPGALARSYVGGARDYADQAGLRFQRTPITDAYQSADCPPAKCHWRDEGFGVLIARLISGA